MSNRKHLFGRFFKYPVPANLLPKFQENNGQRIKDIKNESRLERLWLDNTTLYTDKGGSIYQMELFSNDMARIKTAIGT